VITALSGGGSGILLDFFDFTTDRAADCDPWLVLDFSALSAVAGGSAPLFTAKIDRNRAETIGIVALLMFSAHRGEATHHPIQDLYD
jgi:hypothetical protein